MGQLDTTATAVKTTRSRQESLLTQDLEITTRQDCYEAGDLLIDYLNQLGIEYLYGIPGGAIEPLYNALARSQRKQGIKAVTARHESGAAFMADGYARNSGRLGVCCTTTGPGATNAITGIATAYENKIPLLIITAQTALADHGKGAFQDSGDTAINTVGMFEFCTRYNTAVTHVSQLERKLSNAISQALSFPRGPVHLSIPLDVLSSPAPVSKPSFNLAPKLRGRSEIDQLQIQQVCSEIVKAKKIAFVLGSSSGEAVSAVMRTAMALNANVLTTPDGKGLINPYHPRFKGVIGFAGHKTAEEVLADPAVDLVIAVGAHFGEWNSNGWNTETLLNGRLIQVEADESNLMSSPMAMLHVHGSLKCIFERIAQNLEASGIPVPDYEAERSKESHKETLHFELDNPVFFYKKAEPMKPQWLMHQLTKQFPPNTKYLADTGNSFAWAIHYLHPFDRRIVERRYRQSERTERRNINAGSFQTALEFAPMGWAIGAAVGTAMVSKGKDPVVCITGDGSWLMNGQEVTVANEHKLCVIYVILNDSSLGMVKHGQRSTGAESIGHQLPQVDFAKMAQALGITGLSIKSCEDLLNIDFEAISNKNGPTVLDVYIDPEQTPPMGVRTKTLRNSNLADIW